MSPEHPEESWPSWQQRIGAELAALADSGFVTLAATPGEPSEADDSSNPPRQGWRRRLTRGRGSALTGSTASASATTEVLLQARVLDGVLALECIGDTEFEGLSELTSAQQRQLVDLGWEQDGNDPTFSTTFALVEADTAAVLLERSLREVLGAQRPSQVDTRHS